MNTVSDISKFPLSLQQLSDLIGIEACIFLIEEFGGSGVYIPKKIIEGHKLFRLGSEAIKILTDSFGGSVLRVPIAASSKKWLRNQQIAEARQFKSVPSIARQFGLTERCVWTILQKLRNNASAIDSQSAT